MTEPVDLAQGTKGLLTLRDGRKFWSPIIEAVQVAGSTVDMFRIRIDQGVYHWFTKTGIHCGANNEMHEYPQATDIVVFDPNMKWIESVRGHIKDYVVI